MEAAESEENAERKAANQEEAERNLGAKGYIDGQAMERLRRKIVAGIEYHDGESDLASLMRFMLCLAKYRRNQLLPSYDAIDKLPEYFPSLLPRGIGGPADIGRGIMLKRWAKLAISAYGSQFAGHHDFLFFINSILRRKRISGLSTNAPLAKKVKKELHVIRNMVEIEEDRKLVEKKIEQVIRSGRLSAQFEAMPSTAACWAQLRRDAWDYLIRYGPCQLLITVSSPDVVDPNVYMQIDPTLDRESALKLTSKQRADLLAENPVAAAKVFNRRMEVLFKDVIFEKAKLFGNVRAYLGRREDQARYSPHIHLLLWLNRRAPPLEEAKAVAEFIEIFCAAILPPDHATAINNI